MKVHTLMISFMVKLMTLLLYGQHLLFMLEVCRWHICWLWWCMHVKTSKQKSINILSSNLIHHPMDILEDCNTNSHIDIWKISERIHDFPTSFDIWTTQCEMSEHADRWSLSYSNFQKCPHLLKIVDITFVESGFFQRVWKFVKRNNWIRDSLV